MAKANYHILRKCPICGAIFEIRTIDAVYCSHNCSAVASKRKKDQEEKGKKYEQMAKEIPDIKEYLTATEAIAMFCVERSTLYRDIRLKKLPYVNLGQRQLRLKRSDSDERYELRQKVRKAAKKPIPKTYNMEPENCYATGEISKKYRIHDSSVWTHIRKFSIPTQQIGN